MNRLQKGGVLLETCLLGVVLGLMIVGGRWLMTHQHRLQQLQQISHVNVFAHDAHGKPMQTPSMEQAGLRSHRVFRPAADRYTESLRIELLGMSSGSWQVQSSVGLDRLAGLPAAQTGLALTRRSQLMGGAGQAADMRQTRQRLAASPSAWLRASQDSLRAGQASGRAAGPLDSAWGRPLPDLDWLGPWQDVVPDVDPQEAP
ncbi:MAG TPA: pilus assembly protein TadE [Alcaligenes sp.]|nr:pilus assembly protein TadE [Alcaligenes sp.]HRL26013.1 pilus assembly protein TadE [Alcaligenes sp.]